MLEIRDLTFGYNKNKPVLNHLSLELPEGKIGVLLGKNGAGKSTLFRCLLGLTKCSGSIVFEGKDLAKMKRIDRAKTIAYVPQQIHFGDLTVYDCVMVARLAHFGLAAGSEDRRVVDQVLLDMGLYDLRNENVSRLSGGERQKVAIARALAQEAKLLVFDEPTGNLDVSNEQLFYRLIKDVAAKRNLTILVAVHNLQFALSIGDVYYMMIDGKVRYSGDAGVVNADTIRDVYGIQAKIIKINGINHVIYGGISHEQNT